MRDYQWKMFFILAYPYRLRKLASQRKIEVFPTTFLLNKTHVVCYSYHKYLGVYLEKKLSFQHHIKEKNTKASKGIGVIKKLKNVLPRSALLNIYISFVRPHLDYWGIIYQMYNIVQLWLLLGS